MGMGCVTVRVQVVICSIAPRLGGGRPACCRAAFFYCKHAQLSHWAIPLFVCLEGGGAGGGIRRASHMPASPGAPSSCVCCVCCFPGLLSVRQPHRYYSSCVLPLLLFCLFWGVGVCVRRRRPHSIVRSLFWYARGFLGSSFVRRIRWHYVPRYRVWCHGYLRQDSRFLRALYTRLFYFV